MARKRMLDPGIWTDEGFLELSVLGRLFFIGLISQADDHGRGIASEKSLKARIFPGDSITEDEIDSLCKEIGSHIDVVFYRSEEGSKYYSVSNWKRYQKVDRPSDSIIPPPPPTRSPIDRRTIAERSSSVRPELVEGKQEKEKKGGKEQPPCQPAVDKSPPSEKKTRSPEPEKGVREGGEKPKPEDPPLLCPNALPGGVICMKRLVWSPAKDEWFCPRADKGCGRSYPASEWARKNGTVVPISRKPEERPISPALAQAREWRRRKAEDPASFKAPADLPDPFTREATSDDNPEEVAATR